MRQDYYANIVKSLRGMLDSEDPPEQTFHKILLNACAVRGFVLTEAYRERHGDVVFTGPFQGMHLSTDIVPSFLLSFYIGSYEHELADVMREVARTPYDNLVNIGCAEGYYAVGLARLLPGTHVHAFDILSSARDKCRRLAELNGVADRITIGERFEAAAFERFAGGRTLVLCDIEGGEFDLLDPRAAPALAAMDLIVEIHEGRGERNAAAFHRRFEATHEVVSVAPGAYRGELPPWIRALSEFDVYLASSGFRPFLTPWVFLRSRAQRQAEAPRSDS